MTCYVLYVISIIEHHVLYRWSLRSAVTTRDVNYNTPTFFRVSFSVYNNTLLFAPMEVHV